MKDSATETLAPGITPAAPAASAAAEAASAATCCGIPLPDMLSRRQAEDAAALLKAVADPVRLQLLWFLRQAPNREACVCDLTEVVGLSQPTVSHHLKKLANAGLVTRERRGSWAWFRLVPDRLAEIAQSI